MLAEGFNRTVNITTEEIYRSCSADCFPDGKDHHNGDAQDIVGQMKNKILRNDTSFYKYDFGSLKLTKNIVLFVIIIFNT